MPERDSGHDNYNIPHPTLPPVKGKWRWMYVGVGVLILAAVVLYFVG